MRRFTAGYFGSTCTRRAALVLALLSVGVAAVAADSVVADYLWDHPEEVVVSAEEAAFTTEKFARAKNESIFVMGYFNDGWVVMFSLFHIDLKVLDRWGMYILVADPSGKSYWRTATLNERNIVMSSDHFSYSDGTSYIEDSEERLVLRCSIDGISCDLVLDKRIPAWKPGTGTVEYSEDGEAFQRKAVIAPLADLSGVIEIDGVALNVSGRGYAEWTLFVNSLTRHQPYLQALRLYTPQETAEDESLHIGVHQAVLNKAYDNREITRLVVARGDTWLFTTRDYVFEPLSYHLPDFSPYEYPVEFRLSAHKNGYTLDGVLKERVFFHFTDIFSSLPKWAKAVLVVFFERPVFYRYVADFSGTLTDPDGTVRSIQMSGPFEYVVVF
jgi:hypothetical protein